MLICFSRESGDTSLVSVTSWEIVAKILKSYQLKSIDLSMYIQFLSFGIEIQKHTKLV